MLLTGILEDDSLYGLMWLRIVNKYNKIGYFYYAFLMTTFNGGIVIMVANEEWKQLFDQYISSVGMIPLMFVGYVTRYHRPYTKMFWSTIDEIFPHLWSLRTLGNRDFNKFQKFAKPTIFASKIIIVLALLASTANLPWYGDEYYVYIPVKIAVDYIDGWFLKIFLVIFYSAPYHLAITVLSNVFALTYLVLHLYNQLRMLKVRLENLATCECVTNPLRDTMYQKFVKTELISCIKLHQILLRLFMQKINNYLYYQIFYYTMCDIPLGLSLILLQIFSMVPLRVIFVAVIAICATVGFCMLGQLVESESEKVFTTAYDTCWHLWNTENRKLLWLFLLKTENNLVISCSDIITINHEFLIRLSRALYSALMFLLHII